MSISELDRGDTCVHGDTYGSCPSSQCYIWTVEEVFEDQPELALTIKEIETKATEALGFDVIYVYPSDEENDMPHPKRTETSMFFRARKDHEARIYAVWDFINNMADYKVTGCYISTVIVEKVDA